MNGTKAGGSACVVVGLVVCTARAVNIETVIVGNPGNAADMRYGSRV
jgi:hypothetical protein